MTRKKPFSGRQKKAQLQAKRERKKEEVLVANCANDAQIKVIVDRLNQQPVQDPSKARDVNRYKLHFAHESREEVEKRKAEARLPLRMLPRTALEVGFDDIFPDVKVIDLPKRPPWDYSMSKEEVEANEQRMFDQWIDSVHEQYGEDVGHFEHNLETWRQLWRVLEISDIILLLSDIRHPVIHFPPALYKLVVEEMGKELVFVLNKVDLVTPVTVDAWRSYFQSRFPKLHIACFTSYPNDQPQSIEDVFHKKRVRTKRKRQMARGAEQLLAACEQCMVQKHGELFQFSEWRTRLQPDASPAAPGDGEDGEGVDQDEYESEIEDDSDDDNVEVEAPEVGFVGEEEHAPHMDYVTIGVVGNPNVGKSSLLNGLVGKKVVSTSRTPGHTKHFQTIFLTRNIRLCDSPGLVFPSCVPKQLQVLAGIYPVAQVREPFTAIGYLAQRIPLVDTLRLHWPYDDDEYDADKQWSAWAICDAWAKKRGYVTAKAARLDTHRAANSLLRLAVDGRIVLSIKPPGFYEHLDAEQKAAEEVRAHVAIPEVEDSADDAAGVESGDSDSHEATALRETLNPFALLDDNDC